MDVCGNVENKAAENSIVDNQEVVWYDARKAPFSLHGFHEPKTEPTFRRVPKEVADATSEGVSGLGGMSAGGRVRFSTNSPYVAIRSKQPSVGRSTFETMIETAGFDLYIDGEFGSKCIGEFRIPDDMTDGYVALVYFGEFKERYITINFPIYSVVSNLEIGLNPSASLGGERPYRDIKPVYFYGSSIVNGTGASRPGLIYPNIISRDLNIDFRSLGFAGRAMGEQVMAEWLSKQDMSVFVCDYDHNAPTLEHLETTHYAFYETFRKSNPDVPYIMITRPDFWTRIHEQEHILQRRDIIMTSYLKARANGDKNVYFIDGMSFFTGTHQYECSIDGVHPNDEGYLRMADAIGTMIKYVLERGGVVD